MDFELKTLTRARVCSEKCDALVVLIPQDMAPGDDAVSQLAALAIKAGDFEAKAGKTLTSYRMDGIAARRVVLVGVGDGSLRSIRSAVTSAMNLLKNGNTKSVLVSMAALDKASNDGVRTALVACADAGYAYSTTKASQAPEKLTRVIVAVTSAPDFKNRFRQGCGTDQRHCIGQRMGQPPG